jgi:hypothetical protein
MVIQYSVDRIIRSGGLEYNKSVINSVLVTKNVNHACGTYYNGNCNCG